MEIKVGEAIRLKREEKKISLSSLAKEIGISPGYLSQIENGKKTNPKLDIILKVADVLDIELEVLLGIDPERDSPALKVPSLLHLTIAKDRNLKVLDDKDVQRKVSAILNNVLEAKYLIEDDVLYKLFLEDVNLQIENMLKRYISMGILINNSN